MYRQIGEEERDVIYKIYLYCAKASRSLKLKPDTYSDYVLQRTSVAAGVSPEYINKILQEKRKAKSLVKQAKRHNELRKRNEEDEEEKCIVEEMENKDTQEKYIHEKNDLKVQLEYKYKINIPLVIIDEETGCQVIKLDRKIDFRQIYREARAHTDAREAEKPPEKMTFLSYVVYLNSGTPKTQSCIPILKKIIHIQPAIKVKHNDEKAMSLFDHLGLPSNNNTEKEIMRDMKKQNCKCLPILLLKRKKIEQSATEKISEKTD